MALLADQVVLARGGTHGVDAGIVRAAVREGAHAAFTGRDPEQALGPMRSLVEQQGWVDGLMHVPIPVQRPVTVGASTS